jgi:hypothetical protein
VKRFLASHKSFHLAIAPVRSPRAACLALAALLTLSICGSLHSAVITVGHHVLLPNTPGQAVEILVAGGEMVISMDFYVTLGDGGPEFQGTLQRPTFLLDKAGINGAGLVFDSSPDDHVAGGSLVPGSNGEVLGPGLFAAGGAIVPSNAEQPRTSSTCWRLDAAVGRHNGGGARCDDSTRCHLA